MTTTSTSTSTSTDYAEMEEEILSAEIVASVNLDAEIVARFASERSGYGRDGWESF